MRVLHVIRSDGFAGVERHVVTLASAQARLGHEVAVVGGDPGLMARAGDPSLHLTGARTTWDIVSAVGHLRREFHPDIVHAHMTAAEVGAATALRASRVPLVATRHFARSRGSNPISALTGRVVARRLAGQIAISRYVADHADGSSTVIHPGVANSSSSPVDTTTSHVVLVAQRLEPEKRTDLAVTAFAEAQLVGQGWRLEIAGDGSLRRQTEELAARLGLTGHVRFLGHRSDIATLMRSSAILLAPCPVEGLGLTVLEAMAEGLPVVAARAGGHLETVGRARHAALFDPNDGAEAASLLGHLAADKSLRTAYGAELREIQEQEFTVTGQAQRTIAFYEGLT